MTEHSILVRAHPLDDDMGARITRVLRGTRTSDWGGTLAYKMGLDVLVTLHGRVCCEWPPTDPCWDGVMGESRVSYDKADPEGWWQLVERKAAAHRATPQHGRRAAGAP
jgi:hypothetical protein